MTYMSALSYIHKLAGKADPTQLFVIKKLLAAAQKLSGKPDTRLPISPSILHKIVDATQFIVSSAYLRNMLQSMFLLAFHAADMGMSETQIQLMGRWKSTAFRRYIRIPMLQMNRP